MRRTSPLTTVAIASRGELLNVTAVVLPEAEESVTVRYVPFSFSSVGMSQLPYRYLGYGTYSPDWLVTKLNRFFVTSASAVHGTMP